MFSRSAAGEFMQVNTKKIVSFVHSEHLWSLNISKPRFFVPVNISVDSYGDPALLISVRFDVNTL